MGSKHSGPIFRGKGDIRDCSCYGAVKLLEHNIVEWVLGKLLHRIVSIDEIQFGFIPERRTIKAVTILRRMQVEYYAKIKKLYMCVVDLEKALD